MTERRAPLPADLRYVDESDLGVCYPLMRQLRPNLASVEDFAERWRRQSEGGYRLFALWAETAPHALAGFRILESFIHGRFLYVDDLVTDDGQRGRGYGASLMDRLKIEGLRLGCAKLVLDTGLDNVLGHRFYYRQGLLAMALRFNIPLA